MSRIAKCVSLLSITLFSIFALVTVSYGQASNTWLSAGQLTQARTGAAAVLLQDGRILITGGSDSNGVPQASTEIFDPTTGQFSPAASMNVARANHAAIVLNTGDVLVTGGVTDPGGDYTNSAEIFSAGTQQWTQLQATLPQGLTGHAMALLADGNVLIAGGQSTTGPISTLLLFNATDNSITSVGTLMTARTNAAAAATPDGRVLIAGGADINKNVLASTEIFIYSPATLTGTISAGPAMTYARTAATATATYDGVAVIGGYNMQNGTQTDLGTAEIFSQWTNAFRVVSGATPRSGHFAVRLPNNGAILAMGGTGAQAVDLLEPWANGTAGAFVAASSSLSNQTGGFVSPATLGSILAAGGQGSSAASAELYWFPTIATDQADYPPGTPVVMTGTGFQPGETVDLHLHEWVNQTVTDLPDYSVLAGSNGTFNFTGYAPTTSDLGARYHLTAIGETSALQAQTIFTDGNSAVSGTVKDSVTNLGINGATVTCGPSNGCNASYTTTTAPDGSYSLTVQFAHNSASITLTASASGYVTATTSAFDVSNSINPTENISLTPSQANTTTAVTSSANPSVYGQTVTFTATVSVVAPGSGTPTGTVTFTIDGQAQTPSSLSSGIASFTTSSLSVSPTGHTVSAAYNGATNFKTSSGNLSGGQVVNKADSLSTTTSSVNPSVYGQSVTITATVTAVAPGAGTPTGTVTFKDGATTLAANVALTAGVATFSSSSLAAATHSITAVYSGDTNFNATGADAASTAPALSQVVNKADSLSTTTSSVTPSVYGQSVTITATVTAVAPGAGTPTGTVTFKDGATTLAANVALTAGVATFSSSSLAAATHSITAVYSGDTNFNATGADAASTAPALSHVVNKADSLSTTTSSVNPSVYGQSVTFTATVTAVAPGSGTPTGTVTFMDGTTTLAANVALTAGVASYSTSSLAVASHSITAVYSGDTNFNATGTGASTAPALSQVVNKADTSVTVGTITPEPSVVGQPYSVSVSVAVVAPGAGTPTGTVTIGDGAGTCTATLSAGAGSCNLTSATAGTKTITASYNGDANFNTSSGTASHTVNKADTTTTVGTISPEPSVVGQPYTVNASVGVKSPGSGTPTGTVTIGDGTATCTATLSSAGAGSCDLTSTTAGSKTITASYNGDTNFNTSSGTASHTVNKADTTTTVGTISPEPSVVGQPYTVNASVGVKSPGAGAPTGTVTIGDGATTCTATLTAGAGSCNLTSTTAGSKNITASYNGDTNFNTSSGTASHTVNKADTLSTTTSSVNPSIFGQSVIFTATVMVVAPGSGTPTGTVTFKDGATTLATEALNSLGVATYSSSSLSVASHSITAVYNGDMNFNATGTGASTAPALSQVVNKAKTTTVVTSSANPSVLNQSVTFTAAVSVNSPGAGTPTGTVTFTIDGVQQTPTPLSSAFTATFTTSSLGVSGTGHTIAAVYNGDSNFESSSGNLAQVVQYASGGICDGDAGHQILQPIDPLNRSVFKSTSTTPAKFRVCDANGVSIGTPGVVTSFNLVGVINGTTTTTVLDVVDSTTPDTTFRWDPTGQQWIFNISNKNLGPANQTYIFLITLNDGSKIPFQYGLR